MSTVCISAQSGSSLLGRPSSVLCLLALACVSLGACSVWEADIEPLQEFVPDGRQPIYLDGDPEEIVALAPRAIVEGGSLVRDETMLYIVDVGTGVHILDNTDPGSPVELAFVQVYGVTTISVKASRLFANNFTDLVTIDVSDPTRVRVLDRDPDLFDEEIEFPQNYSGFFECYDSSKGRLIGWRTASLTNPRCRT